MRYELRISRVQSTERMVNAPDEETAIERVTAQLDQGSIYGPWTTDEVEVQILRAQSPEPEGPRREIPAGPMLLSVKQAAREVGLSPHVLYRLIAAGDFPHVRVGRRILIGRDHIRRFIEANSKVGYGFEPA